MICVFDIETVPNVALLRQFLGQEETNDLILCQKAFELQKEKTGSEFLPINLHKIVAISSVIADDYGRFIKVGNFGRDDDEKSIIGDFLAFIDRKNPKLVSYNGRNFDIPTIMLRAMFYNLSATAYYENDNPQFNKNKWENYRQRYSERFHTDLLDALSHFGSIRGMKLDDICVMLNLPGKYDISGDFVHQIYYEDNNDLAEKLKRIQDYCQSDVLNTYWLYLKYELLKGALTLQDYYSILEDFSSKIPNDKPYWGIFTSMISKELENIG
ncbi:MULTISPECIES: 3'-5' exonuclease [unclassified Helicobacter]|uniref:3'-5' exonuclease n=1 Tax=unclassified Helicobacter TaxID=2593540 RepID=UPI000CF05ED0|nr:MULTISPECIES: 3'-5' exonuclease [unclassified Helicobacter]